MRADKITRPESCFVVQVDVIGRRAAHRRFASALGSTTNRVCGVALPRMICDASVGSNIVRRSGRITAIPTIVADAASNHPARGQRKNGEPVRRGVGWAWGEEFAKYPFRSRFARSRCSSASRCAIRSSLGASADSECTDFRKYSARTHDAAPRPFSPLAAASPPSASNQSSSGVRPPLLKVNPP